MATCKSGSDSLLWFGFLSAMMGCSVETLGIYLPKRGKESIQQEDLRRAIWSLERMCQNSSVEDCTDNRLDWWSNRALRVGLRVHQVPNCFVQKQQDPNASMQWMIAQQQPVEIGALASMAKSIDHIDTLENWGFCIAGEWLDLEGNLLYIDALNLPNVSFEKIDFRAIELKLQTTYEELNVEGT